MANPNFDTLASSALRNARNAFADNLSTHIALMAALRKRGGVRKIRGGQTIDEPLMYGDNSTFKSYHGYEILDLTPQEGFTTAQYDWKQLAISISISEREKFINSGSKTRIFNLLEAKIKQADITFREGVNAMQFGDGTGNNGKDLGGLDLLVSQSSSVVGGIDEDDAAWWAPERANVGAAFNAASGSSIVGADVMRAMYNDTMRGPEKVGLIITDSDTVEKYEAYVEGTKSRTTSLSVADFGFDNVAFKGVPMVWDSDCPANTMYFLNLQYLKFVIGEGKDFVMTPFQSPENQDASVATMHLYGNLTCSNRSRQGVIHGYT